jgi:hypothetical protein
MKLEVHERIALLGILPTQSTYVGFKALQKAKEIISFTSEEEKFYGLHIAETGNWEWDGAKASERALDAPMEQFIIETVREKLAEMDANGTLSELYVSLYEKFIINYRAVE